MKTCLEAEVCTAVLAAHVPQQSVRHVRHELDAYLLVDVRLAVVDRQTFKLVLQPSGPVEQEALAFARLEGRQGGGLSTDLALRGGLRNTDV